MFAPNDFPERTFRMKKKILFVTPYRIKGPYDYVAQYNTNSIFRFGFKRYISFGLRFIKQNIPDIEILEYPTLDLYKEKLKEGWDVVGFSFFMFETPRALEMVKMARESGVGEIWGGHYGSLTPDIQNNFDRIFKGYSEYELGEEFGIDVGDIIHPPLVMSLSWAPRINILKYAFPVGILFTSRGCMHHCTFCQTPSFVEGSQVPISLESIEMVVKYYSDYGIKELFIFDESFGALRKHTDAVTNMLSKYNLKWSVMVRTDILNVNLDRWYKRGLGGALLGIESLNQASLKDINKRSKTELTYKVGGSLTSNLRRTICFYIIGFENDTVESVKKDIMELKKLEFDIYQICVLTPLPTTPLWDEIDSKFGIFEKDYSNFDASHLVWNHPHINREEMEDLKNWSLKNVYRKGWFWSETLKFYKRFLSDFRHSDSLLSLFKLFRKGRQLEIQHMDFRAPLNMFEIYHPRKVSKEETPVLQSTQG